MNILLFQRDLRIYDNQALNNIIKDSDSFLPIYIFDLDKRIKNKKFFSLHSFNFLIQCLIDLNNELKKHNLNLYYLNNMEELDNLNIETIYLNNNYSPYYIYRTNILKIKYNCKIFEDDCFLNKYEYYLKKDKTSYSVFGSYLLNSKLYNVQPPNTDIKSLNKKNKIHSKYNLLKFDNFDKSNILNNNVLILGGRIECLNRVKVLIPDNNYYIDLTKRCDIERTNMSPYLKYGCISIRELFYIFKNNKLSLLLDQLNWRNFYMVFAKHQILELYKNEYEKYNNDENKDIININFNNHRKIFYSVEDIYYNHLNSFFKNIKWENDYNLYKKMWIEAKTGFPIIDASVICLKQTGFISNRSRLLLAFFSIKILHLDPFGIYGGQYEFSKYLIDCCFANNKLNWEFGQSSRFDNNSYRFGKKGTLSGRIYDIQTLDAYNKFDPNKIFINKWLGGKIIDGKYIIDKIVDYDKRIKKWYKLTKI